MKKITTATIVLLVTAAITSGRSQERVTALDEAFFSKLAGISVLRRDRYIAQHRNGTVTGTCIVEKTDTLKRYDLKYRIKGKFMSSGFTIYYYLFTSRKIQHNTAKAGKPFTFKGAIKCFTALNTSKDAYIFDIKLAAPENGD